MTQEYVETWYSISQHVGKSERAVRYMAKSKEPLPVIKIGGVTRMYLKDYDAWLEARRLRVKPKLTASEREDIKIILDKAGVPSLDETIGFSSIIDRIQWLVDRVENAQISEVR